MSDGSRTGRSGPECPSTDTRAKTRDSPARYSVRSIDQKATPLVKRQTITYNGTVSSVKHCQRAVPWVSNQIGFFLRAETERCDERSILAAGQQVPWRSAVDLTDLEEASPFLIECGADMVVNLVGSRLGEVRRVRHRESSEGDRYVSRRGNCRCCGREPPSK